MGQELSIGDKITEFENALADLPDQIDISEMGINHYITDSGLYARELFIPKGTVITGKVKKHQHVGVLSQGFVTSVTDTGVKHIKAPYTMISMADTKRIVIAHEDTIWTTIHATKETDLDKIEEDLVITTHANVDGLVDQLLEEDNVMEEAS